MTKRQVLLHYESVLLRERRQRAERLVDANQAFCGGKGAEQHLKMLLK